MSLSLAANIWHNGMTSFHHEQLGKRLTSPETPVVTAQTSKTDYSQVPIIQCSYSLALETQRLIAGFPKHVRYQFGDRLGTMTQEFFERIVQANFIRDADTRYRALDPLSARLFSIRMAIRMAKDLKSISVGQYTVLNASVEDIQRQLTGWTKWTRSNTRPGAARQ